MKNTFNKIYTVVSIFILSFAVGTIFYKVGEQILKVIYELKIL